MREIRLDVQSLAVIVGEKNTLNMCMCVLSGTSSPVVTGLLSFERLVSASFAIFGYHKKKLWKWVKVKRRRRKKREGGRGGGGRRRKRLEERRKMFACWLLRVEKEVCLVAFLWKFLIVCINCVVSTCWCCCCCACYHRNRHRRHHRATVRAFFYFHFKQKAKLAKCLEGTKQPIRWDQKCFK